MWVLPVRDSLFMQLLLVLLLCVLTQVNKYLEAANQYTQQRIAAMAAPAGLGTPPAAGLGLFQPQAFPDLRLGPQPSPQPQPPLPPTAAAVAANGTLGQHVHREDPPGGQTGETGGDAPPPQQQQQQQQQQQADTVSGVGGLSGGPAAASGAGAGARTCTAVLNKHQELLTQQQQQQPRGDTSDDSGGAAVNGGSEGTGRIPLQEQQQPHSLAPQPTPRKQQSADKAATAVS
jgi:hypothetical protein